MYAQKSTTRLSAPRQTTDALVQMIMERDSDLGEHASEVTDLADRVGRALGMHAAELAELNGQQACTTSASSQSRRAFFAREGR